jgi:hypothetical protein
MVIDVVMTVVDLAAEAAIYRPAKKYNVIIEFHSSTGRIERLRFIPRTDG